MTLEDFEKELTTSKQEKVHQRSKDKDRGISRAEQKHRHRHHHSSRHGESLPQDEEHRRKRRRNSYNANREEYPERRNRHHHRRDDPEQSMRSPKTTGPIPATSSELKRDSWMEAPSALDFDYVQKPKKPTSSPKASSLGADFELKLHEKELNHHLRDVRDNTCEGDGDLDQPAQHDISYTIGDAGSGWRMTKLKQIYRQAGQSGRNVEEIALERYGDLREFDDAREEEVELERRQTYGADYVGKEKPNGELFQERKMAAGVRTSSTSEKADSTGLHLEQGCVVATPPPQSAAKSLDQTSLNKLKAQLLKAQLRKDPSAAKLEEEYNRAMTLANTQRPEVVIPGAMENRMLGTAPRNEARPVLNRRGRERGTLEDNEDMSIEDMVREERRTRSQAGGEGRKFAERIAKDAKFDAGLDYMDENASKLAKRVQNSEISLRNTTIGEFRKMNRVLDTCALCHHEDTNIPPLAPVVSLATRTYLTLPTEPEISPGGACIVPIQHRTNLLECDDDEWEEVRNFMKSLTRLYHDQGRSVIFYENAANPARRRHAAMEAVPLANGAAETAPAFFKEALLASEGEWSQHKKIIDTLRRSRGGGSGGGSNDGNDGDGLGKLAFRRSLVKEMPYFHVWFEIDGGMGHVVEDPARWPRGDLFAREIVGAMVDADAETVRRQGRWNKGGGQDARIEKFRRRWSRWDWTRVLLEES